MAYDQSSGYQPPPRAYYGQQPQRQQAPVQQVYRSEAQQGYDYFGQGGGGRYDGYGQDCGQSYPQENRRGGGSGQDQYGGVAPAQQQQGNYQQDRGQNAYATVNGYGQQERSYDPRFQQRDTRGGQAGRGPPPEQPNGQRSHPMQPQQRQDARQRQAQPMDRGPPAPRPGPGPHHGAPLPQQSNPVQPMQQRPMEQQLRSQGPPNGAGRCPRPDEPPQRQLSEQTMPPPSQNVGRNATGRPSRHGPLPTPHAVSAPSAPQSEQVDRMAEWKAKEKAKMHGASKSPGVSSQDNAFPVFFNPRPRQKGQNSTSTGASEERPRPSTSESQRAPAVGLAEQRPSTSGGTSNVQGARGPVPNGRPSFDRPPVPPFPGRQQQAPPTLPAQQPYDQSYNQVASPVDGQQTRWPINDAGFQQQHNDQGHNPPSSASDARRPVMGNVVPTHPQNMQDSYAQERPGGGPAPPQQSLPRQKRGGPPIPPIQTSQQQRHPMPAYTDHQQPLSPAVVPPRPVTASNAKANTSQPVMSSGHNYGSPATGMPRGQGYPGLAQAVTSPGMYSPTTPMAESQYYQQPQDRGPASASRAPHNPRRKHDTINDFYGHYLDDEPSSPPHPTAYTREDEIEAEMPNFDSAAPGQTSGSHQRNRTMDKHLDNRGQSSSVPPQMSAHHAGPRPRFYQQQSQPQTASQPALHYNQANGNVGGGFVFPFSGDTSAQQQQYHPTAPQQQQLPYHQGPPHSQPAVTQTYADGPPQNGERRLPGSSNGPLQPRLDQNGQPIPVRDPFPPQARPDVRPAQGAQPIWSDPGQQRIGSAPPQREVIQSPPVPDVDGGLLQQRHSNPDALPFHPTPVDTLPQGPTPVRPGLALNASSQSNSASHPPPVRSYGVGAARLDSSRSRQASLEVPPQPVTHAELEQLRAAVTANPDNSVKGLLLVKKLVEASTVLASENGRLDARSTAKNRERYILDAHKRLKKLASSGYTEAQFYLADCYGQGALGLEVDTKEAFNLYQAAAKQNHAQAAYRTAVCCEMGPDEGGGTRRDYAKAVQWYRRAATLGDSAAQFKIGMISLRALLGAPRNVGEAITMLKRAAEQADAQNPHALHELAILHEPLNTDPEVRNKLVADEKYARQLFQRAADYGFKSSQFRLGQAYEYGSLGCKVSHRNSIYWYTKAAAQGEHQAELALSGWYLTGAEGVLEHSDQEAYMWARKAAGSEPPLAKALFAMGYFTENGIGCKASLEEARRWYGRAASYRFPQALERLEELKKGGGNGKNRPPPANGKLTRNDQRRDEAECTVM